MADSDKSDSDKPTKPTTSDDLLQDDYGLTPDPAQAVTDSEGTTGSEDERPPVQKEPEVAPESSLADPGPQVGNSEGSDLAMGTIDLEQYGPDGLSEESHKTLSREYDAAGNLVEIEDGPYETIRRTYNDDGILVRTDREVHDAESTSDTPRGHEELPPTEDGVDKSAQGIDESPANEPVAAEQTEGGSDEGLEEDYGLTPHSAEAVTDSEGRAGLESSLSTLGATYDLNVEGAVNAGGEPVIQVLEEAQPTWLRRQGKWIGGGIAAASVTVFLVLTLGGGDEPVAEEPVIAAAESDQEDTESVQQDFDVEGGGDDAETGAEEGGAVELEGLVAELVREQGWFHEDGSSMTFKVENVDPVDGEALVITADGDEATGTFEVSGATITIDVAHPLWGDCSPIPATFDWFINKEEGWLQFSPFPGDCFAQLAFFARGDVGPDEDRVWSPKS